jgi:hypothetical protein
MRIAIYWFLFLGQTVGDATILSHLNPLFRRLVTSRARRKNASDNIRFRGTWSDHNPGLLLAGSVLVREASAGLQPTSWSHNSLSISAFIFAGAVFSSVYLVRFNELEISLWGLVLLSAVLFSIFCYTLGLERLGRALVELKDRS